MGRIIVIIVCLGVMECGRNILTVCVKVRDVTTVIREGNYNSDKVSDTCPVVVECSGLWAHEYEEGPREVRAGGHRGQSCVCVLREVPS